MTDAQLVALIIAAYTLSQDDITSLAESIADARLTVMQASYRRAQKIVGLPGNWMPGQKIEQRIEKQALKDAQSIAATYKQYLSSFVNTALEVEKALQDVQAKGWRDLFGSVKEAVRQMVSNVSEWLGDFMGWKPKQVSNATCGGGMSDGTMQFAQDVVEADKGDGNVQDDNGDIIYSIDDMKLSIPEIGVKVVPSVSSSDFCKDYAGNTYSMDEALSIPSFPAHPSCIHTTIMVVLSEEGE